MSVCTNNTEDFKDTILNCTKALELDPDFSASAEKIQEIEEEQAGA